MFCIFFTAFYGALTCFLSWFACYIIYYLIGFQKYQDLSLFVKLVICIVPYLGIMFGLRLFEKFELAVNYNY